MIAPRAAVGTVDGMTRNYLLPLLGLAVAGTIAAGCGSSSTGHTSAPTPAPAVAKPASAPAKAASATAPMTAQQIATKLVPLGCTATPADSSSDIGIRPEVDLGCTINGEDVSIEQFASHDQIAENIGMAKTVGCQLAKGFGLTDLPIVSGSTWTVVPSTVSTAQAIKAAVGGTVDDVHCA